MKRKILGTIAVILVVAAFSCFAPKVKDKSQPKLDTSIKTVNLSGEIGLDTITSIGLSELGLKDLKIVIVSLTEKEVEEDETLLGYIDQANGYYLIRLKSGLYRDYYVTILAHELQHLLQLHQKRLKIHPSYIEFNRLWYTFSYPYWDRPWEIECFDKEFELKYKILHKMTNPLP